MRLISKIIGNQEKPVSGSGSSSSGGLLPHVIVISDAGSTVILTKGTKVVTAAETSTGHFEADVDEYGTWTIDSILGGDDAQTMLNVDAVKVYTITDEHFSASITVSYPSGGTCTLSATGQTSQAATGSPYTFTVHAAATYTLTATYRGATRTGTVVISTTGQTETYSFLVDGATVLTTDDAEIWLDCACLWDKNYTTEAEIIADSEALLALMSDHNAVDYMVRSGSFRTLICADALAMLYIGQYNDCADSLLADSTWCAAICASEYFELVLSNQVPIMTSNTTPSGVASASSEYNANYQAWKAFTRSPTDRYYPVVDSPDPTWLCYQFPSPKKIYLIRQRSGRILTTAKWYYQGSNDGLTWTTLLTYTETTTYNDAHWYNFALSNQTAYSYYRFLSEGTAYTSQTLSCFPFNLELYGRTDVTPPASRTLKTFATANEAEILEMVCKADRGEIDLYDDAGWRVDQEHSMSISGIAASDGTNYTVGEPQPAHTATIALSNHGGVELVNSVLDKQGQTRTQCSFEYDWKNCFPTKGYMNSSQSNSGSWDSCARRAWCNYGLRNAVSPYIRAASKQFKTITAETYNGSTNKTSNDYFALRAEKELFGSQSYSNSTEAAALSQKTLYDSAASRTKLLGDNGSATPWWERSPNYQGAQFFCNLSNAGEARRDYANTAFGIAPFGAF